MLVCRVYSWVIQEKYTAMAEPPVFDWEDSGFTEGFFVLLLWEFSRQSLQNWLYYLVANKADNISELTRLSGILRGQESFAQAISFGLNTRRWHGGRVPMAVNTILLGMSALQTLFFGQVMKTNPVLHRPRRLSHVAGGEGDSACGRTDSCSASGQRCFRHWR